MKKYLKTHLVDFIIIASLIIISLISLIIINIIEKNNNNIHAQVYIEGEMILDIDLANEDAEREIIINDHIKLMVKKNAIKVLENDCPSQYCVHQGYTSSTSHPIICAYHNLYIKIINGESDVDVVVG